MVGSELLEFTIICTKVEDERVVGRLCRYSYQTTSDIINASICLVTFNSLHIEVASSLYSFCSNGWFLSTSVANAVSSFVRVSGGQRQYTL